jgi:hypothetical protein
MLGSRDEQDKMDHKWRAYSIIELANCLFADLKRVVSSHDCVKFFHGGNFMGLREVVESNDDEIKLRLFQFMDSMTLTSNLLQPLNSRDHPLASQDKVMEVYQTMDEVWINWSKVLDVAFIVPMKELESGRFFLSCSDNTYVIRYSLVGDRMQPFPDFYYFSPFSVEPLGVCLFHSLNTISDHLRRAMFYRPESEITTQTFKLPLFPEKCFLFGFQAGTE